MEPISGLERVEQVAGAVLILVVLVDVFLTVLYARAEASLVSYHLGQAIWWVFRQAAKLSDKWSGRILSFCGPVVLVAIVAVWAFSLALGAALIIHPELGTAVKTSGGSTPTDFITALYAGGNSMSIVGSGSYEPQSTPMRLLFIANSIIGASVLSLTLTYLMQVYTALQRRNSLGLSIHLLTSETADAAHMVAALGPRGKFDGGYSHLITIAEAATKSKESTHFYPVLVYFRFEESFYSVSQFALVALDAVSLINTALDDGEYGWLRESSAVRELDRSSRMLVGTLSSTFSKGSGEAAAPDENTKVVWRDRFEAARRCLAEAGIATSSSSDAAQKYVEFRAEWQPLINSLAPSMALKAQEIDPATARRQPLTQRTQ
jgi:hypothetical protein